MPWSLKKTKQTKTTNYYHICIQSVFILHLIKLLCLYYTSSSYCVYITPHQVTVFILHLIKLLCLYYTSSSYCVYITPHQVTVFILHLIKLLQLCIPSNVSAGDKPAQHLIRSCDVCLWCWGHEPKWWCDVSGVWPKVCWCDVCLWCQGHDPKCVDVMWCQGHDPECVDVMCVCGVGATN